MIRQWISCIFIHKSSWLGITAPNRVLERCQSCYWPRATTVIALLPGHPRRWRAKKANKRRRKDGAAAVSSGRKIDGRKRKKMCRLKSERSGGVKTMHWRYRLFVDQGFYKKKIYSFSFVFSSLLLRAE